jgi:hypothetical protein
MPKETATQRKQRIADLLADYFHRSAELRKLARDVDSMKEQIREEVEPGTYGDYVRSAGTPREITDAEAVKRHFAEIGKPMPVKMTAAPVIVTMNAPK